MKDKRHVYLISDATGETVRSIARACAVQLEDVDVAEQHWPMVRSKRALDIVIEDIESEPGLVFYTLLNHQLAEQLETFCRTRRIPFISVLEPFISLMAQYFGRPAKAMPGRQHSLDAEYFQRIEALNYVLAHDDGQQQPTLDQAEVILVGVSRTSKTPTCIYLANRGVKAANVPIVPGIPLPDVLFTATKPMIVGLTEDPIRLVEIRKNRLRSQEGGRAESSYTDLEQIKQEVVAARRLFAKHGWPIIDVTRRSIEETAAAILQLLGQRHRAPHEGGPIA